MKRVAGRMGIYRAKPAFRRLLEPVAKAMIRSGVSADMVTTAGVVFAGLAGLGVWLGRGGSSWLLLVSVAVLFRTAANALDGMIATTTGTARALGEVFNEVADRLGDIAVFLPMVLVPGVDALLVGGVLASMLVTSYLGVAVKAAGGSRIYTGLMAKPDRMLVVGAGAVAGLIWNPSDAFTWVLWIILGGVIVTFTQRVRQARKELACQ